MDVFVDVEDGEGGGLAVAEAHELGAHTATLVEVLTDEAYGMYFGYVSVEENVRRVLIFKALEYGQRFMIEDRRCEDTIGVGGAYFFYGL